MISKVKKFRNKASGIGLAVLLAITSIVQNPQLVVHAQDVSNTEKEEKTIEAQVIVTKYENLWQNKSNPDAIPPIYVTAGIPVIWYVDVPEDIAVKGCRSTLKIPGIGWGTDTRNREEGHLQLTNGRNLIQRPDANEGDVVLFTPKETGDIIFTCWMGSGCHRNYIRVVENAYQYTDTVTATAIAVTNTPKVEATQTPVIVSPTAITTSAIVASNTPVLKNTYSKLKAGAIAKIIVENAGTETIKFKSLNKKIATVNADGTVTALKKGTATIQVTVGTITLTYKVKVTSNPFLSKKVVTVKKGKTATITVNGKAANTSLQYAKSKLVKISTNKKQTSLKIKGLKTGTTKLKIKINGVVVTLKITVKK